MNGEQKTSHHLHHHHAPPAKILDLPWCTYSFIEYSLHVYVYIAVGVGVLEYACHIFLTTLHYS